MTRYEVAIVGGGPAGSALAWLMARSGASVLLLDDGRHRPSAPRETLLAAAEAGLQRAGLWQFAAAAALPDAFQHGAIWGSDELVWREPGQNGLLLQRGAFDEALRIAANAEGVVRIDGARVQTIDPSGEALTFVEADGRSHTIACDRLVLATGRRPRGDLVPLQERPSRAGDCGVLALRHVRDGQPHGRGRSRSAGMVVVDRRWRRWWRGHAAVLHAGGRRVRRATAAGGGPGRGAWPRGAIARPAPGACHPRHGKGGGDHGERAAVRRCGGDDRSAREPGCREGARRGRPRRRVVDAPRSTIAAWLAPRLGANSMHRWERGLFAGPCGRRRRRSSYAREHASVTHRSGAGLAATSPRLRRVRAARRRCRWRRTLRWSASSCAKADQFASRAMGFVDTTTGDAMSRTSAMCRSCPCCARFDPAAARLADATVVRGATQARLFVLPPRAVHAALQELCCSGAGSRRD
jgi:hypothetical protein